MEEKALWILMGLAVLVAGVIIILAVMNVLQGQVGPSVNIIT